MSPGADAQTAHREFNRSIRDTVKDAIDAFVVPSVIERPTADDIMTLFRDHLGPRSSSSSRSGGTSGPRSRTTKATAGTTKWACTPRFSCIRLSPEGKTFQADHAVQQPEPRAVHAAWQGARDRGPSQSRGHARALHRGRWAESGELTFGRGYPDDDSTSSIAMAAATSSTCSAMRPASLPSSISATSPAPREGNWQPLRLCGNAEQHPGRALSRRRQSPRPQASMGPGLVHLRARRPDHTGRPSARRTTASDPVGYLNRSNIHHVIFRSSNNHLYK